MPRQTPTQLKSRRGDLSASAGRNGAMIAPPSGEITHLDGSETVQRKPDPDANQTGLPEELKTGIEALSGLAMDDVRVHTNSSKPAQLQALAYTQGSDIHLGPGQERHLPHEAWHVVQQKQQRVKATGSVARTPINDSPSLEREADQMAERALTHAPLLAPSVRSAPTWQEQPAQLAKKKNAPKALGYKSLSKANRANKVSKFKNKQRNLGRGRRLHLRHIIPHSDLQAWMLCARRTGNAFSIPGQMRRQIYNLLIFLNEAVEAANWQNAYLAYEGGPLNQSFLQADAATVNHIWQLIEWHKRNLFLGHGGINTAIQNRFDAGKGVQAFRGNAYINNLYAIWFAANTLLGLAPTAIQDTRIFSTHLQSYIIVRTAEHNNSRGLTAAIGWLTRSDYERSG